MVEEEDHPDHQALQVQLALLVKLEDRDPLVLRVLLRNKLDSLAHLVNQEYPVLQAHLDLQVNPEILAFLAIQDQWAMPVVLVQVEDQVHPDLLALKVHLGQLDRANIVLHQELHLAINLS